MRGPFGCCHGYIELRILPEADCVPDVSVQVDDSGHDELAREIDSLSRGWRFEMRRGPNPDYAAIVHDHGGGVSGGLPGPVDQCEILQYLDFAVEDCREQQSEGSGDFHTIYALGSGRSSFPEHIIGRTKYATINPHLVRRAPEAGNIARIAIAFGID